jgi:hypothetical protein
VFPALAGMIRKATGIDVAGKIIESMEKSARPRETKGRADNELALRDHYQNVRDLDSA